MNQTPSADVYPDQLEGSVGKPLATPENHPLVKAAAQTAGFTKYGGVARSRVGRGFEIRSQDSRPPETMAASRTRLLAAAALPP